jgi:transposase
VATWTETSPAIAPRASLTERARAEACRRVGQDGHSVAQVATAFGVSWSTVMAAVRQYGTARVDDPARLQGVVGLGVDETAFLRANARHSTTYVTGMVDVRAARLLDVVLGRSGPVLAQWVRDRPDDWRAGVEVAALDPFRGYAVRHEALVIRVGCKDPPPGCRSSPVKLRAAGPVEVRRSGGKQP